LQSLGVFDLHALELNQSPWQFSGIDWIVDIRLEPVRINHTRTSCFGIQRKEDKSEYLRPLFATPQQAIDSVDRGRTAAGHHGKQTLRASGLDESQDSASKQASGNGASSDSIVPMSGLLARS